MRQSEKPLESMAHLGAFKNMFEEIEDTGGGGLDQVATFCSAALG